MTWHTSYQGDWLPIESTSSITKSILEIKQNLNPKIELSQTVIDAMDVSKMKPFVYSVKKEKLPIYEIGNIEPLLFVKGKMINTTTNSTSDKIEYTFKNGSKIIGTLDQVIKVSEAFKEPIVWKQEFAPKGYYVSHTKGLVPIKDMASKHIKNTLCKLAKEHYYTLSHSQNEDVWKFQNQFTEWIKDNSLIQDLLEELKTRAII